jgi:hypothetical protein
MAQLSGLEVPRETLERAERWFDEIATDEEGATYAYTPQGNATPAMTAAGLLSRLYLGWKPSYPGVKKGAAYLLDHPPSAESRNMYHFYHATRFMYHMGGTAWASWNPRMRDLLLERQDQGGARPHQKGSWTPEGDAFGGALGRVGCTSLALLTLEIYSSVDRLEHRPVPKLTTEKIERLWNDWRDKRPIQANRVTWILAESPAEVVPFLAVRLEPVACIPERFVQLVKDLDDPQFEIRESAMKELEKLGAAAEPALADALAKKPSLEVYRRIEKISQEVDHEIARRSRAIQALEMMATPEARKLLGTLAEGPPRSRFTRDAKAALERLTVSSENK